MKRKSAKLSDRKTESSTLLNSNFLRDDGRSDMCDIELSMTITEASEYILRRVGERRMNKCHVGLVLGSGLGSFAECLKDPVVIDYKDIPHYPKSTVLGHAGKLIIGHIPGHQDMYVMTMKGRKHYYECCDMGLVTFPVRIFKEVGLKAMFTTNATGGINEKFSVGDFMIIEDHINMMPNPCVGANVTMHGPRFHDMSYAYDPELRSLIKLAAMEAKVDIQEGIYVAVTGPSYETPAEIRMFRAWGADCVGMSTAPEVIVGQHCGLRCVGISCITNMAAGVVKGKKLNHKEVEEVAQKRKPDFMRLLHASLVKICKAL